MTTTRIRRRPLRKGAGAVMCADCGVTARADGTGRPITLRCTPDCPCRFCRPATGHGQAPALPDDFAALLRELATNETGRRAPSDPARLLNATIVAAVAKGWTFASISRALGNNHASGARARWRTGRSAILLHQHHGHPAPPAPLPVPDVPR